VFVEWTGNSNWGPSCAFVSPDLHPSLRDSRDAMIDMQKVPSVVDLSHRQFANVSLSRRSHEEVVAKVRARFASIGANAVDPWALVCGDW